MLMTFLHLLFKQWPWAVAYGGFFIVLTGVFIIYNLPLLVIADLLRYTWFIAVGILGLRAQLQAYQLRRLQQLQRQKIIPRQKFQHPILQAYSQALHDLSIRNVKSQQVALKQAQQRQDYLMNWSHEMKTPLMALGTLTENQTQISSEQVQPQLALLQNQIDLLLSYERLADFNHDLDFQWQNLNTLIQPIMQKYAVFFAHKHLRFQAQNTSVQFLTDSKWLTVVLEQIIFNAIKYSQPQQQIILRVHQNQISIHDQGIGIASADLPRVFEPGFTGHNGRQQQVATGMGLYLAKSICDQLSIKLVLTSAPHQGTTATLTFAPQQIQLNNKL
ncbi:sensor histidine kinase [Bombilactobacillus bombi]|uniref:sensor histidine kinase n=1 Tax=Bombilactobacillus bombi TaxID=1303590 RepID=UPI0015E6106C|nr:sensor histidine kinase [Bombilactobacillus bombi]MBA1434396.1 HAMP domain-containing histidine kinase [Bombilactobacillus bombi]